MTLRYGIIGSGMMGQEHIRNIALMDGAQVTAVSDPDEGMRKAAAQEAGGAQSFSDYKDLLSADQCDAYLIASPNDTHHAVMLDVMAAGKPILCEKPLCTTASDCRDLLKQASAPVWVAMEYRYMPPFQGLLNEVQRGTAGTPKMMTIREHRFPFLVKVGDWNRFNLRTGGTLVEKCCHFWDLMRLTLNADPIRVYASAGVDVNHLDESYDGATPDIIDNGFVVVDFANGTRGMLDLCMFAEGSHWQEIITVTGDRARIDMRIPGPRRLHPDATDHHAELEISDRSQISSRTEIVKVDEKLLVAGDHHGSTYYQHLKFRDMVAEGRSDPEVSLQDGLWSVLVGEAAEQSAREHRAIELDPFT